MCDQEKKDDIPTDIFQSGFPKVSSASKTVNESNDKNDYSNEGEELKMQTSSDAHPMQNDNTTSTQNRMTVNGIPNKKQISLRRGKWTPEEERYASVLIEEFEKGTVVDCENGCTLRAYLSRKLHCAPMRISKKFAGKSIGKHVFLARSIAYNNFMPPGKDNVEDNTDKLRELEFKFHLSLHHENGGMLGMYRQNPPLILPNVYLQQNKAQQVSTPQAAPSGISQSSSLLIQGQSQSMILPMPNVMQPCYVNNTMHPPVSRDQVIFPPVNYLGVQNESNNTLDTMLKKAQASSDRIQIETHIEDTSDSKSNGENKISLKPSLNLVTNSNIGAVKSLKLDPTHLSDSTRSEVPQYKLDGSPNVILLFGVDKNKHLHETSQMTPKITNALSYQNIGSNYHSGVKIENGQAYATHSKAVESNESSATHENQNTPQQHSRAHETSISSNMYALFAQQSAVAVSKHSAYCRSDSGGYAKAPNDSSHRSRQSKTNSRKHPGVAIVEDDSTNGKSNTYKAHKSKSDTDSSKTRANDTNQRSRSAGKNSDISKPSSRKRSNLTKYYLNTSGQEFSRNMNPATVSEISSDVGTVTSLSTDSSKASSNTDSGSGSDSACDITSNDQFETFTQKDQHGSVSERKSKKLKCNDSGEAKQ